MLLRLHIWRRALYYRKKCGNIKQRLAEAKDISFVENSKIIFTWVLSGISNHPDAMSVFPGLIAVNAEWAARLVLFDNDEVRDSYRYTIGHEMIHQSGDYVFWESLTKDKRFVNWVSENIGNSESELLMPSIDVRGISSDEVFKAIDEQGYFEISNPTVITED